MKRQDEPGGTADEPWGDGETEPQIGLEAWTIVRLSLVGLLLALLMLGSLLWT